MNLESKIVHGLERISDVFKTLLLEKAKKHRISPIQIQILLFINSHKQEFSGVTYISKEFNLTKPTVSDAVKSLHTKKYIEKDYSSVDNRSYTLFLTPKGEELIRDLEDYSQPIKQILENSNMPNLESFYGLITKLIFQLNQQGVIQVQRTCFACRFYSIKNNQHFCNLIEKPLDQSEVRLDCPEFEGRNS